MRIESLIEDECLALLRRVQFARLACSRDGQPYVIPVYLAYSEAYLYGFATLGQKVEWMRANPKVCVEWDEVTSESAWTSVVAFGEYEELTDKQEQQFAHDLLQCGHGGWWQAGTTADRLRETGKALAAIYFRIHVGPMTGRRAIA